MRLSSAVQTRNGATAGARPSSWRSSHDRAAGERYPTPGATLPLHELLRCARVTRSIRTATVAPIPRGFPDTAPGRPARVGTADIAPIGPVGRVEGEPELPATAAPKPPFRAPRTPDMGRARLLTRARPTGASRMVKSALGCVVSDAELGRGVGNGGLSRTGASRMPSRPVARAVSGARSRTSPLAPPRILDRRFGDALGGVAPRVAGRALSAVRRCARGIRRRRFGRVLDGLRAGREDARGQGRGNRTSRLERRESQDRHFRHADAGLLGGLALRLRLAKVRWPPESLRCSRRRSGPHHSGLTPTSRADRKFAPASMALFSAAPSNCALRRSAPLKLVLRRSACLRSALTIEVGGAKAGQCGLRHTMNRRGVPVATTRARATRNRF